MDGEEKIIKYMNLGARIRLVKFLLTDAIEGACDLYSLKEINPLIDANKKVSKFCNDAEWRLYNDYPNFGKDWIFYGYAFDKPESSKDRLMMLHMCLMLNSYADNILDVLDEKNADQ